MRDAFAEAHSPSSVINSWLLSFCATSSTCSAERFHEKRFGRITHPDRTSGDFGVPIDFPGNHQRDRFVGSFSKHPLASFEIVVAAGKLHRHSLPRLQEFDLLLIDFLAQSIDHRRLNVFRFERRHHFINGRGQVHRDRRVQSVRVLQRDVRMQDPEIRSGGGLVKRPLQLKRKWQAALANVDSLFPRFVGSIGECSWLIDPELGHVRYFNGSFHFCSFKRNFIEADSAFGRN